MKKNIVKTEAIEFYAARTEEHEFVRGKTGLVFCKNCNAVYYKKSWHHNLRHYKNLAENLAIKFLLCPACKMIKNKQFEGEIVILNIPDKFLKELVHLIEAFGRRAYARDSQHRLIEIKKDKRNLIVTSTENQLAKQLAKKIKDAFKKVEEKISYSPAPSDVVYIKLMFLSS